MVDSCPISPFYLVKPYTLALLIKLHREKLKSSLGTKASVNLTMTSLFAGWFLADVDLL
jgi:hypothetical protein